MRFLGRAVFALAVLCWPWTLRAFDVSYGSLFQVANVSVSADKVTLPLSRGQYANIRILTRQTFDLVKSCSGLCVQDAGSGEIKVEEFRAAKTRGGMWIADVSFDGHWLVTFLVFQNKNGYAVKPPEDFRFLDKKLRSLTEKTLTDLAAQDADENFL
ncbi:MAG: hypothetical protein Q4P84_06095 [Elusimicrobiales bacterium]|nr:hypothetical protein [Elusimicrobiales bacterium]